MFFLMSVHQLREKLVYMGDPIADERLTDIIVEGLTGEYYRTKYDAERDTNFGIFRY